MVRGAGREARSLRVANGKCAEVGRPVKTTCLTKHCQIDLRRLLGRVNWSRRSCRFRLVGSATQVLLGVFDVALFVSSVFLCVGVVFVLAILGVEGAVIGVWLDDTVGSAEPLQDSLGGGGRRARIQWVFFFGPRSSRGKVGRDASLVKCMGENVLDWENVQECRREDRVVNDGTGGSRRSRVLCTD